jgi:hypothetical protein
MALFLPGMHSDFAQHLTEEEEADFAELVEMADNVSLIDESNIGVIFVNELLEDYSNTETVETT